MPAGVEGKNLRPIIEGKQSKVRDVLYTGYRHCQRAVRDDRWKLIRYPLVDRTQFFDLSTDPLELNNLADKPEHKVRIAEMTKLLEKEMASYADTSPRPSPIPNPPNGRPRRLETNRQSERGRNPRHKSHVVRVGEHRLRISLCRVIHIGGGQSRMKVKVGLSAGKDFAACCDQIRISQVVTPRR